MQAWAQAQTKHIDKWFYMPAFQIPQQMRGFRFFPFTLHSPDGRPPKRLHLRPHGAQPAYIHTVSRGFRVHISQY